MPPPHFVVVGCRLRRAWLSMPSPACDICRLRRLAGGCCRSGRECRALVQSRGYGLRTGEQAPLGRWHKRHLETQIAHPRILASGRSERATTASAWLRGSWASLYALLVFWRWRNQRSMRDAPSRRMIGDEIFRLASIRRKLDRFSPPSKRTFLAQQPSQRIPERHHHPLAEHAGV